MLIGFFLHLKSARLPVSTREFLTLLEALEARVVSLSIDDFYHLARATLIKDEAQFDRYDLAFATLFQGRRRDLRHPRGDSGGVAAQGVRAAALARGQGEDRGARRLGQADGDASRSGSPSRRRATPAARSGSAPAAPAPSAPTATTPRASASGRTAAAAAARSRSGTSALSATSTATSSSTRATSRSRCAGCAASRARACPRSSTWTARSRARRRTPASSTSISCPSGATG